MDFTKMHGAGNDYVYVNGFTENLDWPKTAISVSDRHTGIGSDGLIVAVHSEIADVGMRTFNADGSEGEMCGNGIRCLVGFAMDNGLIGTEENIVSVETGGEVLEVEPIFDDGFMIGARVSMGAPIFLPADVPVNLPEGNQSDLVLDFPLSIEGQKEHRMSFVSMGNPHAISIINTDVSEFPLSDIGPKVENHDMFPNRINFEIVNIIDRQNMKVRVWERGSGLTMACGTGACAAAVAAQLKGLVGDKVKVKLPGGDLVVEWRPGSSVILEGPIETVFSGTWVDSTH